MLLMTFRKVPVCPGGSEICLNCSNLQTLSGIRTCILMLIVKLVGIHDQGIKRILMDGDLDTRDASSESFPCF